MKRLPVVVLLLLAVSGLRAVRYTASPVVSIKSDFKSRPTFYKSTLRLMDDNRVLYIGRSANWDEPYAYFYDLVGRRKKRMAVPLKAFFSKNTHLLVNGRLTKRMGRSTVNSFHLSTVHFYDSKRGLAGIIVQNRPEYRGENRYLFLFWNIRSNRIVKAVILSRGTGYAYYYYPGGYDQASGTCYLLRSEPSNAPLIRMTLPSGGGRNGDGRTGDDDGRGRDNDRGTGDDDGGGRDNGRGDGDDDGGDDDRGMGDGDSRRGLQPDGSTIVPVAYRNREKRKYVSVYAIRKDSVERVVHFRTENRFNRAVYDPVGKRLMVPEYTEGYMKRAGYGYLVDLEKKSYKKMAIPTTPYGVAFEGQTVYVASAQSGYIWKINAVTGRKLGQAFGWSRGHYLGFVKPGVLLWLRNFGLVFFSTPSMRRIQIIHTNKFYTGFCHVEGSIIVPGMVIMKNGDKFRVVKF